MWLLTHKAYNSVWMIHTMCFNFGNYTLWFSPFLKSKHFILPLFALKALVSYWYILKYCLWCRLPHPFQVWISFPIWKNLISSFLFLPPSPNLFAIYIYFKELTSHGRFAFPCHLGGGYCYPVSEIGKPRLRETLLAKASGKCSQGWTRWSLSNNPSREANVL